MTRVQIPGRNYTRPLGESPGVFCVLSREKQAKSAAGAAPETLPRAGVFAQKYTAAWHRVEKTARVWLLHAASRPRGGLRRAHQPGQGPPLKGDRMSRFVITVAFDLH